MPFSVARARPTEPAGTVSLTQRPAGGSAPAGKRPAEPSAP